MERAVEKRKKQRWMAAADNAGLDSGDEELSNGFIGRTQQSIGHKRSPLRRLRAMTDNEILDLRVRDIEGTDRKDHVAKPLADRAAGIYRNRADSSHGRNRNRHDALKTGLPERGLVAEMNANEIGADLSRRGNAAQIGAIETVGSECVRGGHQQRLPAVRHVLASAPLRSGRCRLLLPDRRDHRPRLVYVHMYI